ncbi:high-affinity methionine permease [[Candida] railenensis]|uniref:High-affinity methionine permease n=1 Tax=[Candida] railenensis TaxID=45579 RepID=A0A9P0QKT1_9ASCO|nr:high-affinity methionine permease [[Candida] railenensis]
MSPTLIPSISTESDVYSHLSAKERRKYHKLSSLSCMSLIVNKMIGTGIFSTPSIIFQYCQGSVPIYLTLWLVGGIIIMSGLLIFLEFSLNLPFKNGGEKNYLLRSFPNPNGLIGCIYSFQMVLLGFSSGNSFAFGKYILFAFGYNSKSDTDWNVKIVGVLCISACIWLHIKYPNQGTQLFNFLGVFKILILVLIIFIGGLAFAGVIDVEDGTPVAPTLVASEIHQSPYSISIALLEIIYSFKGWENANYVLSEVSDPYKVLTVVAPLAVVVTVLLYFFVILSYLIVIPKEEMMNSGVLVAGIFFTKIFGENWASRVLPILIALSNLGNVLVVSFAHGHVNQELAKSNYLPFSDYFTNLNHSLILHWFITVLVLVAPPSSAIYEFVVNLYIYPGTWINILLTLGLIYLKCNSDKERWGVDQQQIQSNLQYQSIEDEENIEEDGPSSYYPDDADTSFTDFDSLLSQPLSSSKRQFSTPGLFIGIFLLANIFLAVLPFIPPPSGSSAAKSPIPYWVFPTVGTGVLVAGGVWFYARDWYNSFAYRKYGTGSPEVKYEEHL